MAPTMRKPWQFSLFRLLLATTVFAAALGLSKAFGLNMIGGVIAAAAVGGLALAPEQQVRKRRGADCLVPTIVALGLAFIFYPMTLVPLGNATNGGILGLVSLIIASGLAWYAFTLNTINPWLRRLFQLPLAAIITQLLIDEVVVQCHLARLLF